MRTPSRAGGSACSATTARAGSRSRSPPRTAPPPITTTSGLNVFTSPTSPNPSRVPISASTSRAGGSPLCASSVTIPPSISLSAASRRPSAESGCSAATRRPSRPIAFPDTSASKQPIPGQSPGHSGPCSAKTECPISAPTPEAPRYTSPFSHSPPPIPVPSEIMTAYRAPAAAPRRASASIDAFPSLSTTTGSPSRSLIRSRNGTPSSGRWFDQRDTPASRSTSAGMPKPTASTSGAAARTSSTASVNMPSVSVRSAPRHVRRTLWWTTICSSTTPPSSLVPPASMPITRRGGMAVDIQRGVNDPTPGPPEYKVYRARRRPRAGGGDLDALRNRLARFRRDDDGDRPQTPREKRPITPGRVLKWVALAIGAWLLLSLVVFVISAQTQGGVSPETERALSSSGSLFSGSIMLVHAAFGSVRKLSIPRDVEVEVPGHGINKINAAYALGGPALTIETVESFLGNGLEVNHLVEVDFANFPDFIDSLGGVTVDNKTRICSPPFDNFWKGEVDLNGKRPLVYSRVGKTPGPPAEGARARAARQQQVLSAIASKAKS